MHGLAPARADLNKLAVFWAKSDVKAKYKVRVVNAVSVPRATHALHDVWLTPGTKQRLDAWQSRVLRRALKIKAACCSRVSNNTVRWVAKAEKLSHALRRKQVRYLAHACRGGGPTCSVCFGPGPRFRHLNGKRRVGKPR